MTATKQYKRSRSEMKNKDGRGKGSAESVRRTAARREDLAIAKVEANGRSAGDQRKEFLRVLTAETEHAERV